MTPTRPLQAAADRRLARVQAVSGLLFLAFVTVHLVNLMLAARGPAAYNGFQRALRPLYQFPPLELGLVVAPLLVHVAAGIRRLRRGPAPRDWRARLHRWSGIFLLVVIFGHIAAVRGSSLVFGVYPEFEGLELSMWLAPTSSIRTTRSLRSPPCTMRSTEPAWPSVSSRSAGRGPRDRASASGRHRRPDRGR